MERSVLLEGRRVRYLESGRGEDVLLLHGFPQSSACFRHQIPVLARHFRVIAPDWPGFGRSEAPRSDPGYDNEVARLDQLTRVLGLTRFNFIAHDYGGFIGLGFTLRHPERVLRLGLLNTRAHGIFSPDFYRFSRVQHWAASHAASAWLLRRLPLRRIHSRGLASQRRRCWDEAIEQEYLGWLDTAEGRQRFVRFFRHYPVPARAELAAGLERIRCPSAVIWGDRDPYIPLATGLELAQRIPHASLTRFADAGHYPLEERPALTTQALLDLLGRDVCVPPVPVRHAAGRPV